MSISLQSVEDERESVGGMCGVDCTETYAGPASATTPIFLSVEGFKTSIVRPSTPLTNSVRRGRGGVISEAWGDGRAVPADCC
jgi:hypothetical protein